MVDSRRAPLYDQAMPWTYEQAMRWLQAHSGRMDRHTNNGLVTVNVIVGEIAATATGNDTQSEIGHLVVKLIDEVRAKLPTSEG